jgi:hypothetical protein
MVTTFFIAVQTMHDLDTRTYIGKQLLALHMDELKLYVPQRYSFWTSSQIAENSAMSHGQWQDADCCHTQAEVSEFSKLDPDSKGRLPLSSFYSHPKNAVHHLVASVGYLGTIEELSAGGLSARIANFILFPTTRIATSSFFSLLP